LAGKVNFVDAAEHLIDDANPLAIEVLSCSGLDKVVADPTIQPSKDGGFQRPFDVTEQNYTLLVCQVLGSMDVGFVEYKVFAVTPSARLTIDVDTALI
jgi:hypothetical protein